MGRAFQVEVEYVNVKKVRKNNLHYVGSIWLEFRICLAEW